MCLNLRMVYDTTCTLVCNDVVCKVETHFQNILLVGMASKNSNNKNLHTSV